MIFKLIKMKKLTIALLIVLMFMILITVLFSMILIKNSHKPENVINNPDTSSIVFTTMDSMIIFSYSNYLQIYKIFQEADMLSMISESYNKTSNNENIGNIGKYKFIYHYISEPYSTSKYHYLIILDTITNNEIYIPKNNKFIDNLTIY